MTITDLRQSHPRQWGMASAIRALSMDAVQAANSGHPGMPMGMADVATVLFDQHLKFDPTEPNWADRDRFVLSAGHGSMLLYSLLHLTGYPGMTMDQLRNFRQIGAKTAGHPEYGHAAGIETTTGPLGQGIATAVGMAVAERHLASKFGKIVDHHTYVVAGDGCLMEGISQEAITMAGHLRLSRLVVLWDDNSISIDGSVDLSDSTNQQMRFESAGWKVLTIDGHDYDAIDKALTIAKKADRPVLIACKTVIGYGSPNKQGTSSTHGAPLGADEITATRAAIGWESDPFVIPTEISEDWAATSRRGHTAREAWEAQFSRLSSTKQREFNRIIAGEAPAKLSATIRRLKKQLSADAPSMATRKSSELTLTHINPVMTETIGGSADLTGSNNTKTPDQNPITPADKSGRYMYYGIREHGMAAAMNGMALHGGVTPYGGTFLVFADYMRGAMRLSALMEQRVIYVLTHDSIGLGEDGPTHQPVEQIAMLRATPNMTVFRPADAVETAECWELALQLNGPSVLALTRQNLPTMRTQHKNNNLCEKGAYVLAEAENKRKVILVATGSEVEIAMAAKTVLEQEGIGTRVVSAPSFELFEQQDDKYRNRVLPRGSVRIGIEAAVRQGWDRWLCGQGGDSRKAEFIGMDSFGASGPYKELYEHFGITAEAVVEAAKAKL